MNLNPLFIPEILGNVFKYLGIPDLLHCRLVCPSWTSEASIFIGTRKIICINSVETLTQLYQLIKESTNQPFRSFEFWSFQIDLDNTQIVQIISTCGQYIHHLTLNFDKDSNNQISVRTLRDLFLYYLPNLKCLAIRQLPLNILSQEWIFPPEGDLIFRQPLLPFLKSLTIYSDADFNTSFLCNILSATKCLEEIIVEYGDEPRNFKKTFLASIFSCSAQLQNLKSLQYFMHDPGSGSEWSWGSEECEKLARMNLKLKSIKLHPGGFEQTQCVYFLLKSLSRSLEHLKLRVHDQLSCPNMIQLTSIVLYDYEGSLVFLDRLPNLRHLGLCEFCPSKELVPDNIVSKNPSNSILSLNLYGSYTVSTHLFRSIASALPNLRILNFWHMNNDKLRIVIEKFPLLEDLTMNVKDVDDEAFTGIPIDLCEQMERLWNFTDYTHRPEQFRVIPFIGQLKNLRRLELHGACLAEWKWSPMSDVSFLLGVVHLSKLTSLSLYEFKWLTDSSIRTICDSLPLLHLKLDPRVFSEDLVTEVKVKCPNMRLEYVTDEFESYSTLSYHAH